MALGIMILGEKVKTDAAPASDTLGSTNDEAGNLMCSENTWNVTIGNGGPLLASPNLFNKTDV